VVGGEVPLRVTCDWGANALRAVPHDAVVIIVDIFSFSTAVSVACSRGASILPCEWSGERAAALAEAEAAVLASKDRSSAFSLSPAALRSLPAGTRMVLPSRNGSAIAHTAREAGFTAVAAGCLRNAGAVSRWIGDRPAAIIAGGERWPDDSIRFAIEDWLGAGALIARLPHARSTEAEAAVASFQRLRGGLGAALRDSFSGRELLAAGWPDDVNLAAELDVDHCVPVLAGNAFVDGGTLPRS
jgi:2-phosphosulfolactate phosphatase